MMKNITLSAPEEVIAKARHLAKEQKTTLNQLVRDYLIELVEKKDRKAIVAKFDELVRQNACHPEKGWRFNREDIYQRGGKSE